MGLFDFFKRRRERESAVQAPDSPTSSEDQPVIGQPVGGGELDIGSMNVQGLSAMEGVEMLSQLGPMIQKAIAEGNVTIEQGPTQTLDLRGTGLREEIFGIMKEHGIDPEKATASQDIDASAYGNMQQQILAALTQHGVDAGASGSSVDFQVKPDDD